VVVDVSQVVSMNRLVETMVTRSHSELWEDVVGILRSKLSDSQFERWIAPLKVLSDLGTEIRLGVANRFVQVWIEKSYFSLIEDAFRSHLGAEVRVRVEIDPALFQQGRLRSRAFGVGLTSVSESLGRLWDGSGASRSSDRRRGAIRPSRSRPRRRPAARKGRRRRSSPSSWGSRTSWPTTPR
jgi:chromosomal replication initiation ATPase DnaA